jgi:hypothetical protein
VIFFVSFFLFAKIADFVFWCGFQCLMLKFLLYLLLYNVSCIILIPLFLLNLLLSMHSLCSLSNSCFLFYVQISGTRHLFV